MTISIPVVLSIACALGATACAIAATHSARQAAKSAKRAEELRRGRR